MFHRHVWKVVEEREQPSPLEVIDKTGSRLTRMRGFGFELESLSRRPVIVKRVCETCGTEEVQRV